MQSRITNKMPLLPDKPSIENWQVDGLINFEEPFCGFLVGKNGFAKSNQIKSIMV